VELGIRDGLKPKCP